MMVTKNIMRYRELPIMNFYDEPMCNAIHAASYDFATKKYLLNNVRSIDVPKINGDLRSHIKKVSLPLKASKDGQNKFIIFVALFLDTI